MKPAVFTAKALEHEEIKDLQQQYEAAGLDLPATMESVVKKRWFCRLVAEVAPVLLDESVKILADILKEKLENKTAVKATN